MSDAPYVILFTGGRELFNKAPQAPVVLMSLITERVAPHRPVMVRHGACPGETSADQVISKWIRRWGVAEKITEDPIPADWDNCVAGCPGPSHRRIKRSGDTAHPGKLGSYCPGAGPRRNAGMVGKGADVCLALPLGLSYGTKGCVRLARKAGIEVVYHPLD